MARVFSSFSRRLGSGSGINRLMTDLGSAMASGDLIMMGGGNPGMIPQITAAVQKRLLEIASSDEASVRFAGIYDGPHGSISFRREMAAVLKRRYDWPLSERNIALTNGSQSAFFALFNMLAGGFDALSPESENETAARKILLPMTPEYIGYADVGVGDDMFVSVRPLIDQHAPHRFKYRIDFDSLPINDTWCDPAIGAICLSRPTNPSGNVVTDEELARLDALARRHDIPLIIDGAYGLPFPGQLYTPVEPHWNDNTILCLSLSKLGLPALRTGIVIADEAVIDALASVTAVTGLAPGSAGAAIAEPWLADDSLLDFGAEIIEPFYRSKRDLALAAFKQSFEGLNYMIHDPEGAMFLWLWLPELSVSAHELYERLKIKGVLVVPGHYFFPGLAEPWTHAEQCLRLTYSQDDEATARGIAIIAEEVRSLRS
ncbi:valine--pyruvate transaminase [Allohahella marinimesophila]|uniref:Valine--pyruvate transaminase n=1 Tax=Allohahella marinimesophila TaxID=1054972 RepID=A0ABP7P4C4_9GAMM